MKFSEQWLREWVNPDIDTDTLGEQLTMAGLEVEAIEAAAPFFDGIVVARIVSCAAHPEADRLQVCQVDDGRDETLTIVCGAANARPGITVPLARIGAQLPSGMVIKQAKLRGMASFGMLCSAAELGLVESAEGLLELPADWQPGTVIQDALELADQCIEIGLTPNRGDCLSIAGIAREVATINRLPVSAPALTAAPVEIDDEQRVVVDDRAACPVYCGRVIRAIDVSKASPLWLQERLRRSGLRSISAVVDVTNLVMLELGQPMHAFDLDNVQGTVYVRRCREGEQLTLLAGREVALQADTLVIADDEKPLALAGIMGGEDSAVSTDSVNIFLEAAHFRPAAIAGKARAYGLHTDSAHRFERGVAASLPEQAIERASTLLLAIVGGQVGPMTTVADTNLQPQQAQVALRRSAVCRLLGVDINSEEIVDILSRLGMQMTAVGDETWQVTPPDYRFDIANEADLIEELARIHGYNQLPDSRPLVAAIMSPLPAAHERLLPWLRQALVDQGYYEMISYSFVEPELQKLLDPEQTPLSLANPLASDISVMRTSLWPGLLTAAHYNQSRQQQRIRFFEIGKRFRGSLAERKEETVLACAVTGAVSPEQWGETMRPADFFDLKGDLEETLGRCLSLRFSACEHPALHPGRSAQITDESSQTIGYIGALHPQLQEKIGLESEVLLCEISLSGVDTSAVHHFHMLSRFPAVRRDLALLVAADLPTGQLQDVLSAALGEQLKEVRVFDVYQGKGIDSGLKSVAIGLTFQDISRTLTDDNIDNMVAAALQAVTTQCGARLRD